MRKENILMLITMICIFFSCEEAVEVKKDYPTVKTFEVSSISENGVTFNGEIKNEYNYEIIEFGFIWGGDSRFNIYKYKQQETIVFTNNLINGRFSKEVKYGMLKDRIYKVRAFIKTKDKIIYGPLISYTSKGGEATKITLIDPNNGVVGDTITLKGENFTTITENIIVNIGGKKANVIESNNSIIKCIVPKEVSIGGNQEAGNIRLFIHGQSFLNSFNISNTKITSVTPLTGTFKEEVTIYGENFSLLPNQNKVVFGNINAPIKSINKNKLVVEVPTNIKYKSTEIKVTLEYKSDTYKEPFVMINPKVLSITPGPYKTNQLITITGENLNPSLINNSVNFYGGSGRSLTAEIISGDTKQLVVKVPEGPYLNREAIINVSFANIYHSNHFKRVISNKWVQIDNIKTKFPIDRKTYSNNIVIANNQPFFSSKLYKVDLHMVRLINGNKFFDWARTPITNTNIVDNGIISALSDGEFPYIYNHSSSNFWKFEESTNTWNKHENFPGVNRENITQFTINGEIYMGFGKSSSKYLTDMYKFSPVTGKWSQIASRPGNSERNNTAVFVINNVAYLIGGATNSGAKDSWAYNSLTNTWSQISDYPYAIDGAAAFELDGEGYVTCGKIVGGNSINEVWKYNPTLNSWTKSESIGNKPRYNHAAYTLNNKAYIVGGIVDNNEEPIYPADIYEFIK